jgi:hypothetical protein
MPDAECHGKSILRKRMNEGSKKTFAAEKPDKNRMATGLLQKASQRKNL